MRSRLEAFETGAPVRPESPEEEAEATEQQQQQQADPEGGRFFKEKLAQFQRISSRGELGEQEQRGRNSQGERPPKLSYSKLIEVR